MKTSKQEVHHLEAMSLIIRQAPANSDAVPRQMLSEEQVLALVPVSRASLYRMIAKGKFPRGTFITPNRRVWFASEIAGWQEAVDERDPLRGRGRIPSKRNPAPKTATR
jgi:predicted DNA-binding transcriptional regulator AlpA